MGPATFCLSMCPGLKRFRTEPKGKGVAAFAYMDDRTLGLAGVTSSTVRATLPLRRKLDMIGIVVKPAV